MRQKGFSLVEMMIALVLGMIVIGAALGVYISTFSANSSQMKYSRLNNDLRTVMTQLTRDLRRATYNNWIPQLAAGGVFANINYVSGNAQPALAIATDSTTVNYDLNASGGATETGESFNYQWVDSNADTYKDSIQTAAGNLIDPLVVRVAHLAIQDISSPTIDLTGAGTADVKVPVYAITIRGVLAAPDCPPPSCMDGQSCPSACIVRTVRETVRLRNPALTLN